MYVNDALISLCSKMGMYGQKGKMLRIFCAGTLQLNTMTVVSFVAFFIFGVG
jgi:hypothetical protein